MTERVLRFSDLSDRHIGVSDGISKFYSEAARVCLDRHHSSPAEFCIKDNETEVRAIAKWLNSDERTKNAWANEVDATEAGAYGLALAAIEEMRGLVAIRRAETLTGADYYLADPNITLEDLENTCRLEVSGTDVGNKTVIKDRLHKKVEQARKGKSNLPAIASVVGFAALQIISADVELT